MNAKLLVTIYSVMAAFYFFVLYDLEKKENEKMRFTWFFLCILNTMTAVIMGVAVV